MPVQCMACGLDWIVPKVGPFSNSSFDEKGRLLYVVEITSVAFGTKDHREVFPIIAKFSPRYRQNSGLFGSGWLIPLLESNIVQVKDNEFLAEMPDGWTRLFYRLNEHPNVLGEAGGWRGEIFPDKIVLNSECGWKLLFKEGKLASITTPQNQTLIYTRNKGNLERVSLNDLDVVRIDRDNKGLVRGFIVPSSTGKTSINKTLVPRKVSIGGVETIVDYQNSLESIEYKNNKIVFNYETSGDRNQVIHINDSTRGYKFISWRASDGVILQEDSYSYVVDQGPENGLKIERVNSKTGSRELWLTDPGKGLESTLTKDGKVVTVRRFTSGRARGKIRRFTQVDPGGKEEVVGYWSYDERGVPIRFEDKVFKCNYDKQNGTISITKFGKLEDIVFVGESKYTLIRGPTDPFLFLGFFDKQNVYQQFHYSEKQSKGLDHLVELLN